MNTIKIILGAALAALFVSGCATDPAVAKAQADAQVMAGQVRVAEANRDAEEARAVQALAAKIDAGGAAAYLIAKAVRGTSSAPAPVQVVQSQPESLLGLAWRSVLQVADIALRGYGIKANRDVGIVTSNNTRDVSLASYSAFAQMGQQIATAGTAGYPYVQAPQPNITLSGTGVIGNGTYTGPVTTTNTTTRTCNGGTAAPGGNATTGPAGPGGTATGGSC